MDIAAIINAAIAQAIEATIATHLTQVQQDYANKMGEMAEKIAKLEARVAEWETTERLPAPTPATITETDPASIIEHFDQQEWFWAKINNYIDRNRLPTEIPEAWLEDIKEIADAAAEEAVNDHCDSYDHDDYDRAVSAVDDFEVDEDMVKDTVKEVLRGAAVSIDI